MKVSAQAMYLYSQPNQAHNPIRRGPPLSYPSTFNYEKDSCSQRQARSQDFLKGGYVDV